MSPQMRFRLKFKNRHAKVTFLTKKLEIDSEIEKKVLSEMKIWFFCCHEICLDFQSWRLNYCTKPYFCQKKRLLLCPH